MNPNNILVFFLCLFFANMQAQDACDKNILKAKSLLKKPSPFTEQSDIFNLVEPCALQGHAEAENYLGMLYLNGVGVEKDIEKAFAHISNAASNGYDNAQYNLGRLYKYGTGCKLDFQKAVDWFETATANGNQRAAYSLGYMYYKGYGVVQDYTKAVYWFERSDDPMAKHFLGLCYYLGYGILANENKALEILLNNPIINSNTLVAHIQADKKSRNETVISEVLDGNISTDSTYIASTVIEDIDISDYQAPLTFEDIVGKWTGKLIHYDWSGKHIERILPFAINFEANDADVLQMKVFFQDKEHEASVQFQDGNVYIDSDMVFNLDKLYSSNPVEHSLDYTLFTLALQKKEYAGVTYLTSAMDTFIESWTEYGEPMSLVLKPEGTESNLDDEALLALAAQDDQFIKLYPVPFNDQLTVQYQLETASNVYVELISLNGTNKIVILPTVLQEAGDYTYTIPVSNSLPEGLYVVRLIAGSQLYTRMIIKDN